LSYRPEEEDCSVMVGENRRHKPRSYHSAP